MSIRKDSRPARRLKTGLAAGLVAALAYSLIPTAIAPATAAPADNGELELTQFVNPLMGTAVSTTSGYAGNVSPGAKVPFGMVTFGPDMARTNYNGAGGYLLSPTAEGGAFNFFSLTHINGPGCPGQGTVGFLPRTDATSVTNANGIPQFPATYKVANESAAPGEYNVTLDNGIKVEFSATERTGAAQFTYPDANSGFFSLDTRLNGTSNMSSTRGEIKTENVSLEISENGRVLSGKTVAPAFCTPWGTKFASNVYFHAEFDKAFKDGIEPNLNEVVNGSTVLQYNLTEEDTTLNMRVGISSVSVENAKLNLDTENPDSSIEEVRDAAKATWNERLNNIQVDKAGEENLSAQDREDLTKFYTQVYRGLGSPTIYSDVNGDFRSMEAKGDHPNAVSIDGYVEERPVANIADYDYTKVDGSKGSYGTHYSGLSFWDSYRSQAQLLSIFAPDVASEVAQSTIVDGLQCGALPHWVDASDDSTPMSGDNALPVLAGKYAFGATDFDLVSAAKLVKQSAFDPESNCNGNKSFWGMEDFEKLGYFTTSDHASANIERYNSDFGALSFLRSVPQEVRDAAGVTQAELDKLEERSNFWTNMIDPETGKFIGREAPTEEGQLGEIVQNPSFHESTEPNYFWTFAQVWEDLIDTTGGNEKAIERLNALFSMDDNLTNKPTLAEFNGGESSQKIYIGNEPSYQAPYAYNWAGKPAGTQYVISELRKTGFHSGRDGMPGNDDLGAQSAWYVFAALGFFPVSSSEAGLAINSPMFQNTTLWIDGEPVRLTTDIDPTNAPFIKNMQIDGQDYGRSWMSADTLKSAKNISFTLSDAPTEWAADTAPRGVAETTTSLELSATTAEIGSKDGVTATVTVSSADKTAPKGTVELRSGDQVLGSAPVGANGITTIPVDLPADAVAGLIEITAVYVSADASFWAESSSAAVELELTAPATPKPEETEKPKPEETEKPKDDEDSEVTTPGDSDKGDDDLAQTGLSDSALIFLAAGVLAIMVGGALVVIRRRSMN
ncbi:glycoside hydrolase domain-containing protein [Jonesiaceae bacterium BS-20]|uniref:Glycoside hydrolase domain-containing protein n=1 Tax=Jonesiaceae bacterium BS-20 TaxID=3120821 RepID=A0AAU7DV08_9MICO